MNAPLRLQAQSNARAPYANRVDPEYFRPDPERADAFIASESKRFADRMQARLERSAPDEYELATTFATSTNAAFYRLMQLAAQGKKDELLEEVKKLTAEAIEQQADHLATKQWQQLDI